MIELLLICIGTLFFISMVVAMVLGVATVISIAMARRKMPKPRPIEHDRRLR